MKKKVGKLLIILLFILLFTFSCSKNNKQKQIKELSESEEESSEELTKEPAKEPTKELTEEPRKELTEEPTKEPAKEPTKEPTKKPTEKPTEGSTGETTEKPENKPTSTSDNQDIKINKSNFPDSNFRGYVSLMADSDNNGVLSLDERNAILTIKDTNYDPEASADYNDAHGDATFDGEKWYELLSNTESFEGIQYFQNLYRIDISGIKLKEVHLDNPNLEVLSLDCRNLSDLTVGHCPKLRLLYIGPSALHDIDLSDTEQLESLSIGTIKYSMSDILKNKNLERLFFKVQDADTLNNNLNELEKLKSLGIGGDCSVKELNLTKLKSLEEIGVNMNVQMLNLEGLKNLQEVSIQKVQDIDVTGCINLRGVFTNMNEDITKLDLSTNENLQRVNCRGSSMKEIILPNDKVYVDGNEDLIIHYASDLDEG